eukprot:5122817-Pyramimonas_sp.AAC.1
MAATKPHAAAYISLWKLICLQLGESRREGEDAIGEGGDATASGYERRRQRTPTPDIDATGGFAKVSYPSPGK